jgi:hypothetical protein
MAYLGTRRSPEATLSNDNTNPFGNGFWRVAFDPATFGFGANDFEIYHIYLTGPTGSQFVMWTDNTPYSTAARGDLNEWDPNFPLHMVGGQTLYFYWNSAGDPKPLVVLACRTQAP